MIDRSSPVPMYYQIQKYLQSMIDRHELSAGDRVPSERELTEQFHVSRMTVRQAIATLVQSGDLVRLKGKGTFVSGRNKIEKELNTLNGFSEDMSGRGMVPGSRILDFSKMPVPSKIAEKLDVPASADCFAIKRVRTADGKPMAIEQSYVVSAYVPSLTREKISGSLYDYLEEKVGLRIGRADQSIEASLLTPEEADILDVPEGSPVLLIERCAFLSDGRPFEWTKSLFRADRYKFYIRLKRK